MLLPGQGLRGRSPLRSPAFRHSNLRRQVPPLLHEARDPSREVLKYGREYCPVIYPKWRLPRYFGIFYMPQITTWSRRLYFPSEERRADDFFALEISRTRYQNPARLILDHQSRSLSTFFAAKTTENISLVYMTPCGLANTYQTLKRRRMYSI